MQILWLSNFRISRVVGKIAMHILLQKKMTMIPIISIQQLLAFLTNTYVNLFLDLIQQYLLDRMDCEQFTCNNCGFPSIVEAKLDKMDQISAKLCDYCSRPRHHISFGEIYKCRSCDFDSLSLDWNRVMEICDSCYRRTISP